MTVIYILSIIGAVALTIWIEKILIFLVDKFWKYMEKDEKKMIHELIENSTRVQGKNDENRQQDREKVS